MVLFLHWALVPDDYPAMKQQERSRRGPAADSFWSPTQPAELEDMNHLSCALSAFSKFATLKVAWLKVKRKSPFLCFLSNCALESIRASLQGWVLGDIGRAVLQPSPGWSFQTCLCIVVVHNKFQFCLLSYIPLTYSKTCTHSHLCGFPLPH